MEKKQMIYLSLGAVLLVAFSYGLFAAINSKQTAKLVDGKALVVKIDGKKITAEDLYTELKRQTGTTIMVNMIDAFIANKEYVTDAAMIQSAQDQINTYRAQYKQSGEDFDAALTSSGYANEAAFKEVLILDAKKTKVVRKYLTDHLTDAEINKYYGDQIYGAITAKHILITPKVTDVMTADQKTAAEATALKTANDVIAQLKAGAKFDTLAKKYSDDAASKASGGLLTAFTNNDVVTEFWSASLALKDGAYTQTPVKSTYGYHVILRISQKAKPTLTEVKSDVMDGLVTKKLKDDTNLTMKTWVLVRKSYNINIYDTTLKSVYDATISKLK